MSEDKGPKQTIPVGHYNKTQQFPKIVMMHSGEDVLTAKVRDLYNSLYIKYHEVYKSDQIFALAYQATVDFEKNWKELKAHVNVNFEKELKENGGEAAIELFKKLDKDSSRRKR